MADQSHVVMTNNHGFFKYFQRSVTDLQEHISRLENHAASNGERSDATEHCRASIARLSNEVQNASSFTPAHDQRTYSEAIKQLSNKLEKARSSFAPKQKFSFKSSGLKSTAPKKNDPVVLSTGADERPNQSDELASDAALDPKQVDQVVHAVEDGGYAQARDGKDSRQHSLSNETAMKLEDHNGEHIIVPASASLATSSGTISRIHHSVIDVSRPTSTGKPFASLTLKDIKESLIVCGRVNGAIHLTKVSNTVIVVTSRQFRMHESHNCNVYLRTSSRPIIEDCSGIRFAPLPETYESDGDRQVESQWKQVDDFKWLKSEPSPNWSVLEPAHRVEASVWRETVPGGAGIGVEDILKAAKLHQPSF